jgi:Cu/Ag efflux pump CusA
MDDASTRRQTVALSASAADIKNLIAFSVRSRWLIVLLTALVVPLGVWSLMRLPIDAVPDITNNQVQINAFAPALSAFEIEKQVTYPIENAIAGTGLNIPAVRATASRRSPPSSPMASTSISRASRSANA